MNKGFTLIELLAVIIILTVLIGMGIFLVNGILKNSRKELSVTQKKNLEKIAETYNVAEGIDNDAYCVSVSTLLKKGYIEGTSVIDPKNKDELTGSIRIKYINNKYTYTYQDKECSPCELVSGKEKEIGSKYECEVKKGTIYNFYVLSNDEDGTTNLIMDSNINAKGEAVKSNDIEDKGTVAWYDISKTNANGPVTAMTYLHNITKDWANVPNIVINHTDLENEHNYGYGKIETKGNVTIITTKDQKTVTATFENLKARLPKSKEIPGGTHTNFLSNYLECDQAENKVDVLYGFWSLDTDGDFDSMAVEYACTIGHDHALVKTDDIGVRPVITIKL